MARCKWLFVKWNTSKGGVYNFARIIGTKYLRPTSLVVRSLYIGSSSLTSTGVDMLVSDDCTIAFSSSNSDLKKGQFMINNKSSK